ncbi:MAG: hypothetical protein FWE34_05040 [Defluviitaleaceae bacterium]|nr:hypothetical protein [Defluviitaleaceae bacterium]
MAQFPMGRFFGRPQHGNPHGGMQFPHMPNQGMQNMHRPSPMHMPMPPQQNYFPPQHMPQNVPRGTFPPSFNNTPQQMPQQNMPPMHLLNPNNDPNVRFEPVPGGTMPNAIPANGMPNPRDIIVKLSNLAQGESNSIIFYESMASAAGISEKEKGLVDELLSNKRKQLQSVTGLFKDLTKSEWGPSEMKVAKAKNYRTDIAFALLQESRLLREISQIYVELEDTAHMRLISSVLHNKMADMAHLMAL